MQQNLLLIIDLMNAAHRMRHVHSELKNSRGRYTGVVFGFMAMMEKLLREFNPAAVIVANESHPAGKIWRKEIYPAYKANRKKWLADESAEEGARRMEFLRQEVGEDLLGHVLPGLRIPTVSVLGCEADDVIGYLTERAASKQIETLIVTTDMDMVQLVNSRAVRVFSPTTEKMYYTALGGTVIDSVGNTHAVSWQNYQLMRAVIGDTSDNIKGIPGIGKKRAADLFTVPMNLGELPSMYMARCRTMHASGLVKKSAFWDRVETNFNILLRNLALMALRGPAVQYGRKKVEAGLHSDVMKSIWDNDVLPCVSANDGSTVGQLVRSSLSADPSPFLNYFRRLEFDWAMSVNNARRVLGRYQQLADSSADLLCKMFAQEVCAGRVLTIQKGYA